MYAQKKSLVIVFSIYLKGDHRHVKLAQIFVSFY